MEKSLVVLNTVYGIFQKWDGHWESFLFPVLYVVLSL